MKTYHYSDEGIKTLNEDDIKERAGYIAGLVVVFAILFYFVSCTKSIFSSHLEFSSILIWFLVIFVPIIAYNIYKHLKQRSLWHQFKITIDEEAMKIYEDEKYPLTIRKKDVQRIEPHGVTYCVKYGMYSNKEKIIPMHLQWKDREEIKAILETWIAENMANKRLESETDDNEDLINHLKKLGKWKEGYRIENHQIKIDGEMLEKYDGNLSAIIENEFITSSTGELIPRNPQKTKDADGDDLPINKPLKKGEQRPGGTAIFEMSNDGRVDMDILRERKNHEFSIGNKELGMFEIKRELAAKYDWNLPRYLANEYGLTVKVDGVIVAYPSWAEVNSDSLDRSEETTLSQQTIPNATIKEDTLEARDKVSSNDDLLNLEISKDELDKIKAFMKKQFNNND